MYPEIWDPQIETLSQRELFEHIEKPKLYAQIAYVLEKSPFYQKKLRNFDLTVEHIIQNFSGVPCTEKQEIVEDQIAFPPFGSNLSVDLDKVQRVHRTSGTTGRPVFIALTKHDIDVIISSGVRCFWASGLRPDDMVIHCLNYCLWMGGFTDHQSLEATGATVIPYGVGNSRNLIESILNIKPTSIHCTPSYLSKLEILIENEFEISPADLGLKKGFFAGEGGLQDPKFRKKIEEVWGLKAMNANYGLADVLSIFGAECREQNGLHFMGQGTLYVELIDPKSCDKLPIEKGVRGEFVLTNLDRQAQPLIRFRTHDVVEILDHTTCRCGRSSFRFQIVGRSDDMITVKGINMYPSAIGNVISEFLDYTTGEFQIIVERKQPVEQIKVKVECKEVFPESRVGYIQTAIGKRIKEKMDVRAQIELVPKGMLPRTEGKTKRLLWI